jgi:type IV pilus assembly protein PilE
VGIEVNKTSMGFTLIELMIVIVIVAVLLTVALPAYQSSVLKSNRAAGKGVLMNIMSRQEQYFINNKAYATDPNELGLPENYYIDNRANRVDASDAIYEIQLVNIATVFTAAKAVPKNVQLKDTRCSTIVLGVTGARTVENASMSATDCW